MLLFCLFFVLFFVFFEGGGFLLLALLTLPLSDLLLLDAAGNKDVEMESQNPGTVAAALAAWDGGSWSARCSWREAHIDPAFRRGRGSASSDRLTATRARAACFTLVEFDQRSAVISLVSGGRIKVALSCHPAHAGTPPKTPTCSALTARAWSELREAACTCARHKAATINF